MYRTRVSERLRAHRAALAALHDTGQLYQPPGNRPGRARLRALAWLQRAEAVLEELAGEGVVPAPRKSENIEALYRKVERLLARAEALSGAAGAEASVARLPGR